MANIGIGLDIGADSTKVVVGRMQRDVFTPMKVALLRGTKDGAGDLARFLSDLKIKGSAVLGVTGKEMIIRYTQVPPMPDWQLKQVMGFEIDDLAAQSGGDLAADFNRLDILSSLSDDDTVLLTLIKNSLLQEHMDMLEGTGVTAKGFTPNSIALFNLLNRTADVDTGTSLVVGIGAENIDVAIVQEGAIIFARNISGGGNLFTQALMEAFNIGQAKAEKVKKESGGQHLFPGGKDCQEPVHHSGPDLFHDPVLLTLLQVPDQGRRSRTGQGFYHRWRSPAQGFCRLPVRQPGRACHPL